MRFRVEGEGFRAEAPSREIQGKRWLLFAHSRSLERFGLFSGFYEGFSQRFLAGCAGVFSGCFLGLRQDLSMVSMC